MQYWYQRTGTVFEYYDSSGKVPPTQLYRKGVAGMGGVRDYHWTAALTLRMVSELHQGFEKYPPVLGLHNFGVLQHGGGGGMTRDEDAYVTDDDSGAAAGGSGGGHGRGGYDSRDGAYSAFRNIDSGNGGAGGDGGVGLSGNNDSDGGGAAFAGIGVVDDLHVDGSNGSSSSDQNGHGAEGAGGVAAAAAVSEGDGLNMIGALGGQRADAAAGVDGSRSGGGL